jgi:CheY-like chemotaxis protein
LLSGRRKLLLADDSPTIQKVISLTFGDEGFAVVAVSDGAQALRALEDGPPPDIVLADVVMPGPDGYELCRRVKQDERLRHVPVVLLVGTFEPFNEAEARRVGADTVLTKPFQSIRDLVSKVGSLLGGGESKPEEETPRAGPQTPEPPQEAAALQADAPAQAESAAPAGSSFDEPHDEPHADPASSFADLGADDELIEARPADAFGAAAVHAATPEPEHAFIEMHDEPEHLADSRFEANGSAVAAAAPHAFGATSSHAGESDAAQERLLSRTEEGSTNRTDESLTNRWDESVMPEQPSFDSRATGAAAADDALLDLGQIESAATVAAAEADDFILDLDFEDELLSPSTNEAGFDAVTTPAGASEARVYEEQGGASPWADAPSAFAEAAHGEQPRHFKESDAAFNAHAESVPSFDVPADEFPSSFAQVEFSSSPSGAAKTPDEAVTEVVMQDGPQGFASYAGAHATVGAPRGFVEPEVVPADEPIAAVVVESSYTDGSVEGDVPRAPTGYDTNPTVETLTEAATEAGAPATFESETGAPSEPPAAAYAVGAARVGLEEPLRADQLSREAIDAIARRVVELMSDKVVREIAWEVVPELAELLVKQRLEEEGKR